MHRYNYLLATYIHSYILANTCLPVAVDDNRIMVTLNGLLEVPPNNLSITDIPPDNSDPLKCSSLNSTVNSIRYT